MPAGTGVWVVKTVAGAHRLERLSKVRPSLDTQPRMRSMPRNPAWPSLVWNTLGFEPRARERPHPADPEQDLLAQPVLASRRRRAGR